MRARTAVGRASILAVLLAALAWPALYNGQPIFFGDTSAYIRGADAGVQAALHRRSAWSLDGGNAIESRAGHAASAVEPGAAPVNAAARAHGSSIADKSILYGRSPYYGALLYLGDLTGGFWLTVALQALAVLAALALAIRAVQAPLWPLLPITVVFSALATTAPFFVSFLMPDVFAGIGILAAAALLAEHGRLERADFVAAVFLLSLSVVFHDSHILIAGALLALGLARNVLAHSWANRRGLTGVAMALGVAVLAQVGFRVAVERVVGAAPLRPPFLMARMIEDGPGFEYLRETCPGNGFAVCAFLSRLPMPANLFVWESGPRGVFGSASPEVRRRIADEQIPFVWAVVTHHPWEELRASLADAGSLITMAGLDEFQYDKGEKASFAAKIPLVYLARLERSPAYRGTMPTAWLSIVTFTTYLIGAGIVIAALVRHSVRSRLPRPLVEISVWILIGVVVNALVCGILSGPHNRYAARVSWLIPFSALLIGAALAAARRHARADATGVLSPGLVPDGRHPGSS